MREFGLIKVGTGGVGVAVAWCGVTRVVARDFVLSLITHDSSDGNQSSQYFNSIQG